MSGNRSSRRTLLGATALAGALSMFVVAGAWAQDAQIQFDQPAQPLSQALRSYSAVADREIMFADALVAGHTAPALKGAYTPESALLALLDGTDLTVSRTASGVLLVQRASDPQSGSAAGDGAEGTVQALIVTAQKREEDIQDVPIAISAFSQKDLETHQIAGGPDLITQVPNMTFTKTNFTSYSIQLRGIGTQAISATTDPGVAVAFNNTPFIRNRFFEQEFYDLERVEVLRGPQGTLYGRNATAGVVNIISQKPRFVAEAKLSADAANYSSTRLEGMVNIPLVEDKVALRLAGAWTKRNGYATNQLTGNPIDGRDLWSTRLSLRMAPTDKIDATLIWEHFEENDDRIRSGKQLCHKDNVTQVGNVTLTSYGQIFPDAGQSGFPVQSTLSQGCIPDSLYSSDSFGTPNGLSVPYYYPLNYIGLPAARLDPYASLTQSQDLRAIESIVDPKYKAMADLGELQVSWGLGDDLTLASETAYSADFVWSTQDFNRFNTAAGAWLTTPPFVDNNIIDENGFFTDPQVGKSDRLVAIDLSTGKSRQFSQELRLSSDYGGPFNFSLGANFLRFDGEDKYYVFINSLTLVSIGDRFGSFDPFDPPGTNVPWISGVSDNSQCARNGALNGDFHTGLGYSCVYIEPNSIENIQDQGHNYFLSKNPYRLISYAVFGEVYYNITDNLKLTGGLRWTVDKKHAPRIPSWTLAGETRGYPVLEIIDQEWREPTGRLAIDWKPDLSFTDQTLLYASYSHGYKAGGANPPPMMIISGDFFGGTPASVTRPKTFNPEFVDAFELGAKNTLADGKVTLNLSAFYYDYKDYQISEIVDRSAFNRNFDATIWGLELEAEWRPLENLKLGFKGGYENTAIADGERAIDLMDRTAGTPGWVVVRPFPTAASSCVLPVYVFTDPVNGGYFKNAGSQSGGGPGGCELAYLQDLDPRTRLPYNPSDHQTYASGTLAPYPGYAGFNPDDESVFQHNHGEGFFKNLGGNHLPNAPEFTGTITADYTLPLPNEWLMTLHTDLYAQSNSYWRVFNDKTFDKLHPYFTMNLAAIFTNENAGWKVMAYVKNVLDRTSITGAFLNSDDTGLTTNVFLTEPRLYGLRVTKDWTGGPLWGSFGARHDGRYPFEVEIGGQAQRHDAPNENLVPSFMDEFSSTLNPLADQQANELDWGDGREVKVTYRPGDAWQVSLGARFGKTNGATPWVQRKEFGDKVCPVTLAYCQLPPDAYYYAPYNEYINYSVSSVRQREEHTIVDFLVGKEVGLGGLSRSKLSGGLRYADLESTTDVHIFGVTHWNITADSTKYDGFAYRDRFDGQLNADRSFKGLGPVISWDGSKALLGGTQTGSLNVDWELTGGVLFGKRKTVISGKEVGEYFSSQFGPKYGSYVHPLLPTTTTNLPSVNMVRSKSVAAPTYGASLGLSYEVDRFRIGAGYRWERYQNAIDGGFAESKSEDRTIDGPYFKIAVGFGG